MFNLSRLIVAYAVAIPLALVLGYLVATPDLASIAVVGFVLFFLALPLLLQWHHALLIFFWASAFNAFFLPGQPHFWLVFAALSFGVAALNHIMGHKTFLPAPELTKPVLLLAGIIIFTAWYRGGLGLRSLGGSHYGSRNYAYLLGGIVGYFALTARRIPLAGSERMVKWYFLSAMSFALSNVVYLLGPAFYILYYLLPTNVGSQVAIDWGQNVVLRFEGLAPAAIGLFCFVLARWGIRGLFAVDKPWRMLLFLAAVVTGFFSGYRSTVGLLLIILLVQFMVEGLWRTVLLPISLGLGLLCAVPMLVFADKMPAPVQRALSALPVTVQPDIRLETTGSTEWRFEIWRRVWRDDVPKYLLIGKGYSLDPTDVFLMVEGIQMGLIDDYEGAILSGGYHSGGLSVLVPIGIFGAIAFVWLLGAGVKVLYCNHRYGDPRLKRINDFLLSYFLAQSFCFFAIFGGFDSQLPLFLGVLGLSVSLNGGVCRKPAVARQIVLPTPMAAPLAVA